MESKAATDHRYYRGSLWGLMMDEVINTTKSGHFRIVYRWRCILITLRPYEQRIMHINKASKVNIILIEAPINIQSMFIDLIKKRNRRRNVATLHLCGRHKITNMNINFTVAATNYYFYQCGPNARRGRTADF